MKNTNFVYLNSKFEIDTLESHYLVKASYRQCLHENGWNFLHISTNSDADLLDQHRGAGYIEGYLTYQEIYCAYKNLEGAIIKKKELSENTQKFVDDQFRYIEFMIKENKDSLFWRYAEAYLEQLRFIYKGFQARLKKQNKQEYFLTFNQFYCLTNVGDLQDLIPAFHDKSLMGPNCNGYVKLLNDKIYVTQATHNIFSFLLRIFKTYEFPTKDKRVGSEWMCFSSRPGDLISKDDFYVLSSQLKVIETSFNNFDFENYKSLNPKTVPCWLRATIACNLARDNREWVEYFLKERSGTHNNQWFVINPRQLNSKQQIVTCVQEGFQLHEVIDLTKTFLQKGYFGSYNVPISEKIYKKMGYEKHGFTYENDPRAVILEKYNKRIQNTEDMKKWLIMNEEEDVKVGLAPRYDLAKQNPSAFGLTDCKIYEPDSEKIQIISGPSTSAGRFQPFSWDNWKQIPHLGMPTEWNFPWTQFPITVFK